MGARTTMKPANRPADTGKNRVYVIEMTSETFGSEIFEYTTEQARLAGLARLLAKATTLKDGIERTYCFGQRQNEDVVGAEIAAEFDGKTVTFCEYGLPSTATAERTPA